MNGARRAELEEAEGHPGFTALPHPSRLLGVPGYPRLWDEGLQAAWELYVVGALSVPTLGRHPSRSLLCGGHPSVCSLGHPPQCLGKPHQPELKQGFHRQRKINTRIPHHLLYLQSGGCPLSPFK